MSKAVTFGCGAFLLASSFVAEAQVYEVTISGNILSTDGRPELSETARATVVVELEATEQVTPTVGYDGVYFAETILSVSYSFENDLGEPIDFGYPARFEVPIGQQADNRFSEFYSGFFFSYSELSYSDNNENHLAYFNLTGYEGVRVADYRDDFVLFNEISGPGSYVHSVFLIDSPVTDALERFSIVVDKLTVEEVALDADGDGIPSSKDLCSASDLSEGVYLNGIYTGVTNYVDETGCSLADYYAACEVSPEEAARIAYSGPTYCTMQLGYQFYRDGLITYTELRMLRNAW
ncbi:hypothetical protein CWI80_03960 [Pseudidiomarina sediminum]|uniref:Uncharacterized protein n=1 Tax=Pseudidiomarina sediminum TaxID=431675 RepID=A0A432Z9A0_9GAMM|nr:hypothetical protein [Pseudidiomarina sediminum]RUO74505.1 hypothetical protein CWI80_03960 [Pseudidiomarina sediminum]